MPRPMAPPMPQATPTIGVERYPSLEWPTFPLQACREFVPWWRELALGNRRSSPLLSLHARCHRNRRKTPPKSTPDQPRPAPAPASPAGFRENRHPGMAEPSQRPAHTGLPDRRGHRDRDGRHVGHGGAAALANANRARGRPWYAGADGLPEMRSVPGHSPLARRVGLPGQGLSRPRASGSPRAAVVPRDPPACTALAQARAVFTEGLESKAVAGADCAPGSGDACELEASEPRSDKAETTPCPTWSS
jgi:hypothetical protein